ncbi:MAG: hypothetical protein WA952_11100, partial [Lewinella sp.]
MTPDKVDVPMARFPYLLTLLLLGLRVSAQSQYVPAYLVDETGEEVAVEILDRDWVDNPRRFRYREGNDDRVGTLEGIREFGYADGSLRYLRATVDIDRSDDRPSKLSSSPQPLYESDTVFLEWLVDGEADLFYWEKGEVRRLFYRLGDAAPTPLVNRRYRRGYRIIDQALYRGQLRTDVNCDVPDYAFKDLTYQREDLVHYFADYNDCRGADYRKSLRPPAPGNVRLYLRPGGAYFFGELRTDNGAPTPEVSPLVETLGARVGLEVEMVLPLANERWSLFAEAYVQRVSSGGDSTTAPGSTVNLRSVNVPLGVRRYFYLSGDRSLFIQG